MAKRKNTNELKVKGIDVHTNSIERKIVFSWLNRKQFAEIQHLLTFLFLVPSCFILISIALVHRSCQNVCSRFRTVDNP